jgi:hypothetical protein
MSERGLLEDISVDGRMILNGSSRNMMGSWTGLIWHRTGQMADCFEQGKKLPVSINGANSLTS